jgi:hypothetical protein
MFMLVLTPVYMRVVLGAFDSLSASGQRAAELGFSHAYVGAARHAITVGFISLTILGMAAKVVPTLNGVDIRKLSSLWLPFILVNAGCFMRVLFQIGTDFAEWTFPIAGVSGLLEVAGIGIWGVHLWRIMAGWHPADAENRRPSRITADDKVGWIVYWFPQTLPVLIAKGFTPLQNPVLRRTMARAVSLRTVAKQHNLDEGDLVNELNLAAGVGANVDTGHAEYSVSQHHETTGKDLSLPVL